MSQFLIILPCQIWCCPTSWQSLLVSQLQKLIRILRGQFLYVPCWLDQAGVEEWNGLNLLSVAGGDMVLEVHGDSCPTPCILNSVALFLVNAYSEMSDSFNLFIYIYIHVGTYVLAGFMEPYSTERTCYSPIISVNRSVTDTSPGLRILGISKLVHHLHGM